MKEAVAHALNSSLEWDDLHEKAVDKLTAFSYGDRLGTLLWRTKYDNCAKSFKPAVFLLAMHLKPLNKQFAIRVAEQAMREWLFAFCPTCLGAKEIKTDTLLVTCAHCEGSGVRRYTDQERKLAIGSHVPQHIKKVHDVLGDFDRAITAVMRVKLNKWP